jgi:hypothetical protein
MLIPIEIGRFPRIMLLSESTKPTDERGSRCNPLLALNSLNSAIDAARLGPQYFYVNTVRSSVQTYWKSSDNVAACNH